MSACALLLAAAAGTIPFLVGFQEVQVLGQDGTRVGELLVVRYVQAHEDGLPEEERPAFRDLLVRVDSQYAGGDRKARLGMVRQYLTVASPARFGSCSEAILLTDHGDGVRYRMCVSGNTAAGPSSVALVEDLTTSQRVFIHLTTVRGEGEPPLEILDRIRQRYEERLAEARQAQDRERAAKLAEAFDAEVARLRLDATSSGEPVSVAEVEVNGVWGMTTLRPGESVTGLLGSLWRQAVVTPGFADRFSLLLRVLDDLFSTDDRSLAGVRVIPPFIDDAEEGVEDVPGPPWAAWRVRELQLKRGAHVRSLLEFMPCPDDLVKTYYPRRRWDPPRPGLTFAERVERMERGKGW